MKNPGIYVLTNRINHKRYVGKDENHPIRTNTHVSVNCPGCPLIHRAIKKYGAENFDVEFIPYPGISSEALCEVEKWKIAQLNTKAPNGYNLTDGGDGTIGYKHTEKTKQQISKTIREKAAKGEHHMQEPEVASRVGAKVRKRMLKLAARGKHPFQDPEISARAKASQTRREQASRGEHPSQQAGLKSKFSYVHRMRGKKIRRYRYRLFAVLLYTQSVMLEYRSRKLKREGFFDKTAPDTSNAVQLNMF